MRLSPTLPIPRQWRRCLRKFRGSLRVSTSGQTTPGISGMGSGDVEELMGKRRKQAEELSATGEISTFIDRTVSITDEQWRRMQAVHVDGSFYCCREALKS